MEIEKHITTMNATISDSDDMIKTKQYYQSTYVDFREFWISDNDLAMHFGYSDGEHMSHSQSLIRMNQELAKLVKITKNDRVLDAGCGFGGSTLWLAENFECEVTGVNILPSQLEVGRMAAKKRHLSHLVKFSLQDYSSTTFKNGSFSVVWALETLFHNRNKKGIVSEVYRLLANMGRFLLVEFMLSVNTRSNKFLDEQIQLIEDGWALNKIITLERYIEILNSNAFENIQVYILTEQVCASVRRLGNVCRDSLSDAKIKFQNGKWEKQRYKNVEASIAVDELLSLGLLDYVAIVADKSEL